MLEEWFNISYFYEIFLGYWWNALYVVHLSGVSVLYCPKKGQNHDADICMAVSDTTHYSAQSVVYGACA